MITIVVPLHDPTPDEYVIRIFSDRWMGASN
jgi:hypothetical protein